MAITATDIKRRKNVRKALQKETMSMNEGDSLRRQETGSKFSLRGKEIPFRNRGDTRVKFFCALSISGLDKY